MNQFESVKAAVTPRQAAENYGLTVGRNGMTCCPFHKDRHPSMNQMWCEDNGYRAIAQRSVSSYLKSRLEDYNLEASNKITNKSGKKVNGFWGIQALTAPIIL